MKAYDAPMATDDLAIELATRAYRRILEQQRPGVVWMRLTPRELKRLGFVPAATRPGDIDRRVVRPHDVNAAA